MFLLTACGGAAPTPKIIYVTPAPTPVVTPSPTVAPTLAPTPTPEPTAEPTPEIHALAVEAVLTDFTMNSITFDDNGDCYGRGLYSDLGLSAPLTINDVLGVLDTRQDEPFTCTFFGSVDVPDAEVYQVRLGQQPPSAFHRDELEANDWRVDLTLR